MQRNQLKHLTSLLLLSVMQNCGDRGPQVRLADVTRVWITEAELTCLLLCPSLTWTQLGERNLQKWLQCCGSGLLSPHKSSWFLEVLSLLVCCWRVSLEFWCEAVPGDSAESKVCFVVMVTEGQVSVGAWYPFCHMLLVRKKVGKDRQMKKVPHKDLASDITHREKNCLKQKARK